ncbi:Ltp family lipoprotein [Acinetobacter sp. ANC 7454]|uniref:Ltp family lipoprotein n=1 Tax=Acinetobacter thermotolerans TaxID=3151487 RepID=UPI00325AEE8D
MKTILKWVAIIFIVLLVIGLVFGDESPEQASTTPIAETESNIETESMPSHQVSNPEAPNLTGPQKNAIRSAKQYLSFTAFSREGLIQQLSSSYGDGYDVADATVAVDSLDVNWNEQAVKAAKQYLELSGFSCNGLIEQLSSSAGDKYTVDQAKYGAQQAGACS